MKGEVEEVHAESLGMKPILLRRSSFVRCFLIVRGLVGRGMKVGEVLKLNGFLSTCTESQRVGLKGVVPLWISFEELCRERDRGEIESDALIDGRTDRQMDRPSVPPGSCDSTAEYLT